jgi:elongation factor Ts
MAAISAALVKELREKSGAGMMDCKKALVESGGELEVAVDWLRKNGLAAAAKKAGRVAAEGLVGVATEGRRGAVVEVNAETDFVARNEAFQEFVRGCAQLALGSAGDIEALKGMTYPGTSHTVTDQLTQLIATIGENMNLRRTAVIEVPEGAVAAYVHNQAAPGLGKIGVLVGLASAGDQERLGAFGKQVAMHVAAVQPQAIDKDALDPEAIERERAILSDQARASGKPEEIVAKMVEGRLRKFYQEVCLIDQTFVVDGESSVGKAVEAIGKDLGAAVTVTQFERYQLGEGIDKQNG